MVSRTGAINFLLNLKTLKVMKTGVWVSYNYGGWSLIFSKEFDLPFTPFYEMSLLDNGDGWENNVSCDNNDYRRTIIQYDIDKACFTVDVRNVWKRPVSEETIDRTISCFVEGNWKRKDTTCIKQLKELMSRDVETYKDFR